VDVQLPGKTLRLGSRAARSGRHCTHPASVPKVAPRNGYIVIGLIGVALVSVLCFYSIGRAALQDRGRQIEWTIKVGNVVDSKLVIKGAPDSNYGR